jgi:two-component system, NarL family, nitrate/nitrite response regulator NarL
MPTSSANPIRVLLIDDHVVMRIGLRMVIDSQLGLTVVGEATNRAEALQIATREPSDVILLDLDLGDENGLDFLPDLLAAAKGARVIVLTGLRDPQEYRRAVRLGAMGLVLKEQGPRVLAQAIKRVHAGQAWLDPALVATVLGEAALARGRKTAPQAVEVAKLTERECAVIALICESLRNKQIAERLFISETTVVHHLTSIFSKLGVANRLELVIYAYSHGLAQPPR